MIVRKLYAENLIGLGLFNYQIAIDANDINGLIALRGDNGAGKSTILSMLTPYTVMPRVGGIMVPISDYIYDINKDAIKILDFEFKKVLYRSKFIIRTSGKTKKIFAYLYELNRQTNKVEKVLVDGRISEYEEYINKHFIDEKVYFALFFVSQMSLSFSQYNKKDLRDLLGVFVNTRFYEYLFERAKIVLNEHKKILIELNAKKSTILQMQNQIQDKLNLQDINVFIKKLEDLKDSYDKFKNVIEDLQLDVDVLNKKVNELSIEKYRLQNFYDESINNIKIQEQEFQKSLTAIISKIQLYKNIVQKRDEILQADNDYPLLDSAIKLIDVNKQIKVLQEKQNLLKENIVYAKQIAEQINNLRIKINLQYKDKDAKLIKKNIDNIQQEIIAIEQLLGDINSKKELIKDINCNNTECILIKDIYDTIKKEDEAIQKLAELKQDLFIARDSLHILEQINELENSTKTERELQLEYTAVSGNLKEYLDIKNDLIDEISQIKGRDKEIILNAIQSQDIKGIEKLKKQYLTAISNKSLLLDAEQQLFMLQTEQQVLMDKIKELDADQQITKIIKERDEKIAKYEKDILDQTIQLKELQQKIKDYMQKNEAVNSQIIEITTQLNLLETQQEQIQELEQNIINLNNEIVFQDKKIQSYEIIKDAYSSNGIPDMIINEIVNVVSDHTNKILSSAFGDNYNIQFKTIHTTKTGNENATLEIYVNDKRDNTVKHISMLSGGEQVWVTTALAISLCNLYCQQYGIDKVDMFIDEKDGTLDKASREKFFLLLSKGMTDKINNVYLISQSPAIVNYANYIINVNELKHNNKLIINNLKYDMD